MEYYREHRNRPTPICPTDIWQKGKSNSTEENSLFWQMVLEQLNIHREKNQLWPKPFYKIYTKGNSKWIMDLIARCKSINLSEKNRIKSLGSKTKQRVLRIDGKSIINGWNKWTNWNSSKFKNFTLQKTLLQRWKDKLSTRKKCLYTMYLK